MGLMSHQASRVSDDDALGNHKTFKRVKTVKFTADDDDDDSLGNYQQSESPSIKVPKNLKFTESFCSYMKPNDGDEVDADLLVKVKVLGEGAFATVELCRMASETGDKAKLVAVKRLKPELVKNPEDLQCFVAECSTLRELSHPNIVPFLGVGSDNKTTVENELKSLFLVQEYAHDGTLRDLLLKQGMSASKVYTNTQALDICKDVASGLEYIHGLRPYHLLHRDLKPANILLHITTEIIDGRKQKVIHAKLADLGLCKVMECRAAQMGRTLRKARSSLGSAYFNLAEEAATSNISDLKLTGKTGSLLYMAPEVHGTPHESDPTYDESSDIFSLGLIIWEVFRHVLREMYFEQPDQLVRCAEDTASGVRPAIPAKWPQELQDLVADCWHQCPRQRPTAIEVRERLEKLRPVIQKTMDKPGVISKLMSKFKLTK